MHMSNAAPPSPPLPCVPQVIKLRQQHNVKFERAVMSLQHPFLLRLVRTFQDDRFLHMLTEFVPGGELFSLLGQYESFSLPHTRFYTACVVEGLTQLHERCIVYRDLKPENLLIDAQGYLRIVDFGCVHAPM
jgi:cGMP-dependent protein kinase